MTKQSDANKEKRGRSSPRRKLMLVAWVGLAVVFTALLVSTNRKREDRRQSKSTTTDTNSMAARTYPAPQQMRPAERPIEPTRGGPLPYPKDIAVGARTLPGYAYSGRQPPPTPDEVAPASSNTPAPVSKP